MNFGVSGVPREHVPDPVPVLREVPPPPVDPLVPEFTRAMALRRLTGRDFPAGQLIPEFVRPRRAHHDGYGEIRPEVVRPVPPSDTEGPRQAAAFGEFDEDDDRFDLPTPIDDAVDEEILSFPEPDAIRDENSGIGDDLPDGLPEVVTGDEGFPEIGIDLSEGEVDPMPEVVTREDGFPDLGIDLDGWDQADETFALPEPVVQVPDPVDVPEQVGEPEAVPSVPDAVEEAELEAVLIPAMVDEPLEVVDEPLKVVDEPLEVVDEPGSMKTPEVPVPAEIWSVVELPVVRPASQRREAGPVGEIGSGFEIGEARNDLPRWGDDLPDPVAADGPLEAFFDKAALTLGWVALEHLVNAFLPGAGSLVRIAYFVGKYQAVLAGLNDGRGADLQVGLAGDGPLSLVFTIRLGAVDDGAAPRFGLLLELNFMDPLGQGRLDAQGPDAVAAVVTPEGRPYSSLWDLYGIEAVRDHATVLGLAASLTPAEVEQLLLTLRRKWVRCCYTVDRAAGSATITVEDGYGIKTVGVPLS